MPGGRTKLELRDYIRDIPDFPKPGIMFKDITPLLSDPEAFGESISRFHDHFVNQGITVIAAAEARGFIFGAPLALELKAGFVPIRKPGKLPYATIAQEYQLEYGSDKLEVHSDAFGPGQRVLLIDDVLATGGTMTAAAELCVRAGYQVSALATLIDLNIVVGYRWRDLAVRTVLSY
jgi:adenine phosphoribosyltransferase